MSTRPRQSGFAVILTIIIVAAIALSISYLLLSSKVSPSKNNQGSSQPNNPLQTACANAINDYPEWTKTDTDLIIWENPDKNFYFRNSPEDASSKIDSPIPSTETLIDMDFIGTNEISFITTSNAKWNIYTAKLNWPGPPDKSLIYEKTEAFSSLYTSPISRNEFLVLIINGNKGTLKIINTSTSKEEVLSEISSIKTDNLKLSVSPKGTSAYLLQNGDLLFFEVNSKKQTDKITAVTSAVWVGDKYALYSGTDGTYIYALETKEKSKLEKIESVSELSFHPKEKGTIAFTENGNAKAVSCQTWQIINTKEGAKLKTLTSDKTAITQKGDQYGFWRFKDNDWGVKILEEKSKYVTIWQRY